MESMNPHKHLKEQFVSNLDGTSMVEIAALLTNGFILMVLRHLFSSYNPIETSLKKNDDGVAASKSCTAHMVTISLDFLIMVFPLLLFMTVLSDLNFTWVILLTIMLGFSMVAKRSSSSPAYMEGQQYPFRTSLTSYRISVMILTCLSILAVDFNIYPRRYAKAETYGTGLMDLGVGSFVVANAIVSRQARSISSGTWMNTLKSTSPLILLGFIRLITTAGVDYQVHVGEYGVHWNFFFTLACVSILTSVISIPPQYSGIVGSMVLAGYQTWLSRGLNGYLLSNERGEDIISKNKEGLFSIFGYWGMYLLGVHIGYYLFFRHRSSRDNKGAVVKVWLISLLFWLLTIFLDHYVEKVSRRMCNMSYVTWVLAQNLQGLAIFMICTYISGSKTSALEEALNRNLLPSFLLANLLTGLVNFSVDTLFASTLSSLLILVAYSFTLSAAIGIIDFYGIRLKFW